jgi:hypothetical protein
MALSPDGKTVASGGGRLGTQIQGVLVLCDVATGKEVHKFEGIPHQVSAVAFAPDGKTLAWGEQKGIHFWDVATTREVRQIAVEHWVNHLAFSPDGKTVMGVYGNTIRRWDVSTGRELGQGFGHLDEVTFVGFAADGKTLVSASREDYTVRFWDLATSEQRQIVQGSSPHFDTYPQFNHVLLRPDGRGVIAEAGLKGFALWDVATGQELRQFPLLTPVRKRNMWVSGAALSPDGKTLTVLTGVEPNGNDTTETALVLAWDVATGKELVS